MRIQLFQKFLFSEAADECVVSKAGRSTFGVNRFFSSISNKVIPSISFLSVNNHDSYSVSTEQIIRSKKNISKKNQQKEKNEIATFYR